MIKVRRRLCRLVVISSNGTTDTFNLAQISVHNGIEHDASLTRKLFRLSVLLHLTVNLLSFLLHTAILSSSSSCPS